MDELLEQELLDAEDAREIARPVRYMIRSAADPGLYWSDEAGWCEYSNADVYEPVEQEHKKLPDEAEWVPLEEAAPLVVQPEKELKDVLTPERLAGIGEVLHERGFLTELEWHPAGRVFGRFTFDSPVLLVRSVLPALASASMKLGESEGINALEVAASLDQDIECQLVEDQRDFVYIWHQMPHWDRWNETWIFESWLVPINARQRDAVRQEVKARRPSSVLPHEFDCPAGLSEDGRAAWRIITGLLATEGVANGGGERVMYTPEGWLARTEAGHPGGELVVLHEDGDHAPYFNLNYHGHLLYAKMSLALQQAGLRMEHITNDHSVIRRCELTEDQLRRVVEAGADEEEEEEFERAQLGDVAALDPVLHKTQNVMADYGLEPEREAKRKILKAKPCLELYARSTRKIDMRQANLLGNEVATALQNQLGVRISWAVWFIIVEGRWVYQFFVPIPETFEALRPENSEDDPKDVYYPETKEDRVRQLFTNMGLHIESMIEEPADPGWGDLGKPHRFVSAVLQPESDRPWTTAPLAGPELADLVRRGKSALGEILGTTSVEASTKYDQELGAWRVSWIIDDPEINQHRVVEAEVEPDDDLDLVKDVELEQPVFEPGDLVRVPGSHWPDMVGWIAHPVNSEADRTWWVEWGRDPSLNGYKRSSELELVERPGGHKEIIEQLLEHSEPGDDDRVAVVAVFRPKSDGEGYETLVVRREVDPEAGKWCIAGGHAEVGEGILDGARREMKEETDLDLDELTFVKRMRNAERDAYVSVYGTMMPKGEKAVAGDDAEKLKWVPLDDLPELAFDNEKLIHEIADKMGITDKEPALAESVLDRNRVEASSQLGEAISADDPFPADQIEKMAQQWFKSNGRHLLSDESRWELGFAFYLDPNGKLTTTDLARGEEAEIEIPSAPEGCDEVGSLHTHVGSIGDFSDFDVQEGQKMADKLGHPYYMFVIGPDDEGGLMMSQELFEPGGVQESKKVTKFVLAQATGASRFEQMIGEDKAKNNHGREGFLIVFEGIDGAGKCWARGTCVLMSDGFVKKVENILPGDRVMGPDSSPRTVLALGRGRENMYRVIPIKGTPFTCNESHILTLKIAGTKTPFKNMQSDRTVTMTVRDFIRQSKCFRRYAQLYRTGVDFKTAEVKIDPYFLGLWLGDGTASNTEITSFDRIIAARVFMEGKIRGLAVTLHGSKKARYRVVGEATVKNSNSLKNDLRFYGVLNNKHIPKEYLINDEQNRLHLLAGLLDTDGHLTHNGFDFVTKHEQLCNDILFLARSLGFAAYERPAQKTCQTGATDVYWRISISGDTDRIPTRIWKKRARKRQIGKDWLVTGIKEIKPLGEDEYFGFTLKEDPYFLLADFTVVHNTTQVERLCDWLNDQDYSYVSTKWASSKALQQALWKAKCKRRLNPMSFSLLHASDMHIRYENIVVPALKKGKVVICDRYYFTSYVRDKIRGIDDELLDIVYDDFRKPDLVFFCHVPVRIAVERLMADRGVGFYSSGQDVGYKTKGIERTTEKYEQDMQDRYTKLFKDEPNVISLDMARPIKEIAKDIKKEMKKRLGLDESQEPEHVHQETGYTCGPTCIKMVANALGLAKQMTVQELATASQSDPITGTDDKRMQLGLKAAGVPFKVGDARDTEGLTKALAAGSLIILRTLTRGAKHWIVVYRFTDGVFHILDPWLGRITYTPEELLAIWKPRDYFYFDIPRVAEAQDDDLDDVDFGELEEKHKWTLLASDNGRWYFHNKPSEITLTVRRDTNEWYVFKLAFPGSVYAMKDAVFKTSAEAVEAAIEWASSDPVFLARLEPPKWIESVPGVVTRLNEQAPPQVLFVRVTEEVIPAMEEAMKLAFPGQAEWVARYSRNMMDPDISVVALEDGEVVGFYALGRRQVIDGTYNMDRLEDLSPYEDKLGVEGVALGVIPRARGHGIGNRLKDYPRHLGVDYVWGLQLKELNNLQYWLKRRRLVAKSNAGYATLEDLK